MSQIMRILKNFLRTQNVSSNFVTKLHHYLQVWTYPKRMITDFKNLHENANF